ncbi:binding-protein-dependent transport systems inner membrane component [Paenibacillus curdlanolyticus YK9]|uniref:Binding-protein-dependent transport systems inner membrane component n=1 Tax=Paenibacillus curdlanolyticus YK9 TaxID=717606 RepID=E0I3Y4_9BACL|nr:ABC transporter permease [Paenibacillus curdlanolyticus]EFM12998.1 binding-protein-dependent transport systems inner membrane component [Paenibacillus curdlanolyticus YK9]
MASNWRKIVPPAIVLALIVIVWQLVVDGGAVERWELPSPTDIVHEAASIAPRLLDHTSATLQLALIGFMIGAAAGIVLAAFLHLIPGAREAISPLLILSQNIPIIVLAPLLVLWFGFGLTPKIVLVTLVCFFPVAVSMLTGLRERDARLAEYLRMLGAGRWRLFASLELPYSIPYVFSGLKIAATYSMTSAVVAEWVGADRGLGYFMQLSRKGFMAPRVFAAVIIIVAISLALYSVIVLIERLMIRWRPKKEERA